MVAQEDLKRIDAGITNSQDYFTQLLKDVKGNANVSQSQIDSIMKKAQADINAAGGIKKLSVYDINKIMLAACGTSILPQLNNEKAVTDVFDSMHDYFVAENKLGDANNIQTHKDYYLEGKYRPTYNPDKFKYDSARDQDRYRGIFKNGHVTIQIEQKDTVDQKIAEGFAYGIAESLIPPLMALDIFEKIGKSVKWDEYFKFNPGAILQEGDITVYYSNHSSGGYGSSYHYRGEELLYNSDDGGGLVQAGENFWEYVEEQRYSPKDNQISDVTGIFLEVITDFLK